MPPLDLAEPSLPDVSLDFKPLSKSSETYASLTRKGNIQNPSEAEKNLEPKLASPRQALHYVKSVVGSAENTLLKDIFSNPQNSVIDKTLGNLGTAGIFELNGIFKGLTGQDIEVDPETIKAVSAGGVSPEIAHVAGQAIGGTILWASMGAAMRVGSLAEAAGSYLYKVPALVKYVKPAIEWGLSMGGAGVFKEGIKQIDEGKLDFERFGKIVTQDSLEGAVGGAIVGGMPTGSLSKGLLRASGAAAYGFGSSKLAGASTGEATANAVTMALFATASTNQVTEAQREGIYKTGLKATSEAFKEEGLAKGYSPAESEQLGTKAAQGLNTIIEEGGGIQNLNVGKMEETLAKVKDVAKKMVDVKPAEDVLQFEKPAQIESSESQPKIEQVLSQPPKFPKQESIKDRTYPTTSILSDLIKTPPKGVEDIEQFIQREGGINPNLPESSDVKELQNRKIVNIKTGKSLDRMREAATEAGYNLPPDSTGSDLLDLVSRHSQGEKQYPLGDMGMEPPRPVEDLNKQEAIKAIGELKDLSKKGKLNQQETLLLNDLYAHRKMLEGITPDEEPELGTILKDVREKMQMSTPKMRAELFPGAGDFAEEVAKAIPPAKDALTNAFNRVKTTASAFWDWYSKPPAYTEYKKSLGNYLGVRQKSSLETQRFAKEIMAKIPDRTTQEAITNYIQASGDMDLLQHRMDSSSNEYKPAYQKAMNLTDEEKVAAAQFERYFSTALVRAQEAGILEHGVENYVKQQWEKGSPAIRRILAGMNAGLLNKNPSFAKEKIFKSYFEGEQYGEKPKDKRIGYQIATYNQALNEAVAARGFIKDISNGNMPDGRPIVTLSGYAKEVKGKGGVVEAYFIKPRFNPEDAKDYRVLDHPALKKWRSVQRDAEGNQIYMESDMLIHPEAYNHLKNVLGISKLREWWLTKNALELSRQFKSMLLSFSGFHQVQEGLHAVFHKVNPAAAPEINLKDPIQMELVNHGLMIADQGALSEFAEGVASTDIVNKIPKIGASMEKYQQYLFQDYIPRLKMKMASDALERNLERYSTQLNRDQILEMTANQANAAFGELNYKMMGRNPTMQDVFRLVALAPDFLEARARFVGQAIKPYGMEQLAALVRGALGLYVGARILNQMINDDPMWDAPFGVVAGGKVYSLRSIPGDLMHLVKDPRSFIYHRLNPTTTRTAMEALTGRDIQGRQRSEMQQIKDLAENLIPIPAKGMFKAEDRGLLEAVLNSIAVSSYRYKSAAESLAVKLKGNRMPTNIVTDAQAKQYKESMKVVDTLREDGISQAAVREQMATGNFSPQKMQQIVRRAQLTPLQDAVKSLTMDEAFQVLDKASDKEKESLRVIVLQKFENTYKRMSPEDVKATVGKLKEMGLLK